MLALVTSFVSLLAAVSAKQSLSVEVDAPSDFTIDTLQLTTSVVNTGDEPITLLKDPRTLLSPWATNTFAVTNEAGATPEFTGVKVRFALEATPSGSQLITLTPGDALEVSHEVGKYYNFTSTGEGSYTFEPVNIFTAVAKDGTFSDIVAETTPIVVSLTGQLASSQSLAASRIGGVTKKLKSQLSKRARYALCTSTQQTIIAVAILNAETYATNAAIHLTNNPSGSTLQTTWYGTFVGSRYNATLNSFTILRTAPSNWIYDCSCFDRSVDAYVNVGDYGRVYLCSAFWQLPATGPSSQAVTIIREGTHFSQVLGTEDITYGESVCQALAISNPTLAFDNAYNHAYFSIHA